MTDYQRLLLFAGTILKQHRDHMGDVDGAAIQDAAIAAGLLEPKTITDSCGCGADTCCADIKNPPYDCFFLSRLGDDAIKAASPIGEDISVSESLVSPIDQEPFIMLCDGNGHDWRRLFRADYERLRATGMLWEFHPDAPEEWPAIRYAFTFNDPSPFGDFSNATPALVYATRETALSERARLLGLNMGLECGPVMEVSP